MKLSKLASCRGFCLTPRVAGLDSRLIYRGNWLGLVDLPGELVDPKHDWWI